MDGRVKKGVYIFLIFMLVFPLNLSIEYSLRNNNMFEQLDTLFNIDIPNRYNLFADGSGGDGLSLMHPNLFLVHAPVRVISMGLEKGAVTSDSNKTRREVAMVVSPLVAAMTAIVLFLLLTNLNVAPFRAILVSLFSAYSFSGLIFGSVTDHFIIGGLSIVLTFWLAERTIAKQNLAIIPWVLVGVFVASVTVTNFAIFAIILFLMTVMYKELDPALRKTILISVLAIAITFSLHLAVSYIKNGVFGINQSSYGSVQLDDFLHFSIDNFSEVLFVIINSISPAGYVSLLDSFGELVFTFERPLKVQFVKILPGLLTLSLVLAGAVAGWRSGKRKIQYFVYACVLVLVFNLSFHLFWGDEYFLYSQHWNIALFILLAGLLLNTRNVGRFATIFVSVLLVSVLINNFALVWSIQSEYQELNPRLDQVNFDCEREEERKHGVYLLCK